ncbi:uncharacterized protein LOC144288960 [Canis aureus]
MQKRSLKYIPRVISYNFRPCVVPKIANPRNHQGAHTNANTRGFIYKLELGSKYTQHSHSGVGTWTLREKTPMSSPALTTGNYTNCCPGDTPLSLASRQRAAPQKYETPNFSIHMWTSKDCALHCWGIC